MSSLLALRRRYLVVMGLPAFVACTKGSSATGPSGSATTSASAPVATTTATTSASAADWAVASAVPSASAPRGASGGGGCGTVTICKPAGKKPANPAPAPYEACAATIEADVDHADPHREGAFDADVTKEKRRQSPTACCWVAPRALCGGGRPLRGPTAPIVASPSAGATASAWTDAELAARPTTPERALADRFVQDALFEHASVASFARTSLQLLSLGAPAELVAAAHAAATDEIAHARVTFALARRRGAAAVGPGPLAVTDAPFATTVAAFVRDTLLDGCVAETAAALDVAARAAGEDPRLDAVERSALAVIAADEQRHADLAWQMLAWAVRTFGAPARAALRDAASTLAPSALVTEVVEPCVAALLTPPCAEGATPEGSSVAPMR
jgi:hypothetical protein